LLSDGPVPLFLSGHSDGPGQHHLEDPSSKDRSEAIVSRRILKTGVLTASAIAIVFALFFEETTRAVVVNAKASFSGMQPRQSDTAPASSAPQPLRDARLANAGQPSASGVEITGSSRASPTTAATPTREEIASAFQAALQSQAAVTQPPPAPSPARRLDADELAALLKRAKSFIAIGDIASARLLLERAADAQEAGAALLLAQTYDPAVLGTPDARSITPDPATARGWYQKAARLGSRDAQQRLDQMPN
jgi:TPR repeat protein